MIFARRHCLGATRLVLMLAWTCCWQARFSAWAYSSSNAVIQYRARTWQVEEGLPQDSVNALLQARDGYLWVGTVRGLARFDGVSFKVFNTQNTPQIKNSSVTCLCQGADGSLWIGTAGGGVTQLKDGNFKAYDVGGEPRANNVKAMLAARDGSLWVGTLNGLFQLQNGRWKHFTTNEGLLHDVIRSLAEMDDQIFVGTTAGLCILKNGVVTRRPGISDKVIRTIWADTDGTLWFGLAVGVGHLKKDGKLYEYSVRSGLPDNIVSAIFRDQHGDLWFGTFGGLSRFVNGKFTTELDGAGTLFDQVNVIGQDQEGDVWVGTRDGLHELRARRFTTYTRQNGLAHNNIMSVLEDWEGNIWVGTWGGGISRLNESGVANFNWENSARNGLSTDLILSLWEDDDGSLLIGSDYEGGAFRLDGDRFSRIWDAHQAMEYSVIRAIYRDREGNLWFGSATGLVLWDQNKHRKFLNGVTIRCMLEDHAGSLWVGTSEGLFQRKKNDFEKWNPGEKSLQGTILSLHEDERGSLWIGTLTNGLSRLDQGRLATYTTAQGMFSDDIFAILEDDQGWLWLSCSHGIFRVSKKNLDDLDAKKTSSLNCIAYGTSDGMETVQCSGVGKPSGWKSRDGRLWFATAKGVVVTDPNLGLKTNERPPPALIEEVIADRREYPVETRGNGTSVLRIPPGNGDLEFNYTGLSFQAPEKMRFKYRLVGVDPDWKEVTRRVAFYNHLRPGNYMFRVRACNNDGVWSESDTAIAIVLAPHLWQTWWFLGSAAFLVVALAGGAVRYSTRRNMEQELRRLEKQHAIEEERIRIARDMHDEIGAKLTKISFLGAMAKRKISAPHEVSAQIDTMSQTARDVIRALDEIVWAVNPANDTLEHLATYLCRNATEFFESSQMVCQFNIPDELPPCTVGTDVRHNVLLAAKEAMNNVLKHSNATNVLVQISFESDILELVIADNGCGFNGNEAVPARETSSLRVGDGLRNMRERLSVIGGRCEITSNPNRGSRIVFRVTLKRDI